MQARGRIQPSQRRSNMIFLQFFGLHLESMAFIVLAIWVGCAGGGSLATLSAQPCYNPCVRAVYPQTPRRVTLMSKAPSPRLDIDGQELYGLDENLPAEVDVFQTLDHEVISRHQSRKLCDSRYLTSMARIASSDHRVLGRINYNLDSNRIQNQSVRMDFASQDYGVVKAAMGTGVSREDGDKLMNDAKHNRAAMQRDRQYELDVTGTCGGNLTSMCDGGQGQRPWRTLMINSSSRTIGLKSVWLRWEWTLGNLCRLRGGAQGDDWTTSERVESVMSKRIEGESSAPAGWVKNLMEKYGGAKETMTREELSDMEDDDIIGGLDDWEGGDDYADEGESEGEEDSADQNDDWGDDDKDGKRRSKKEESAGAARGKSKKALKNKQSDAMQVSSGGGKDSGMTRKGDASKGGLMGTMLAGIKEGLQTFETAPTHDGASKLWGEAGEGESSSSAPMWGPGRGQIESCITSRWDEQFPEDAQRWKTTSYHDDIVYAEGYESEYLHANMTYKKYPPFYVTALSLFNQLSGSNISLTPSPNTWHPWSMNRLRKYRPWGQIVREMAEEHEMGLEQQGLKPVRNRTRERYGLQLLEACDLVSKDLNITTEKGPHGVDMAAADEALRLGAEVDFRGHYSLTPLLILSAVDGYVDLKQRLLEAGADVNAQDVVGNTPLHEAVRYRGPGDRRCIESVQLLLDWGANTSIKTYFGQTPIEAAEDALYHTEIREGRLSTDGAHARRIVEMVGGDVDAGWRRFCIAWEQQRLKEEQGGTCNEGAQEKAEDDNEQESHSTSSEEEETKKNGLRRLNKGWKGRNGKRADVKPSHGDLVNGTASTVEGEGKQGDDEDTTIDEDDSFDPYDTSSADNW